VRRRLLIALVALSALAVAGVLVALPFRGHSKASTSTITVKDYVRLEVSRTKPQRPKGPHDAPVPILMYHVIAAPPAGAPFPDLYVLPTDFDGQVRWLAAHGYHAVTLRRVYDFWRGERALPSKPIVLSFDDGYRSHFTAAMPTLRARRWPGVLNLEVRNLKPVWGTRPGMVRKLIAAGWEIDAHTLTNPDLTTLSPDRLTQEVAGSRQEIRKRFGVPVEFFCYPSGRYDDGVVAAVKAAGYLGATTTRLGLATPRNLFALSRVRVDGSDGVAGLQHKLAVASAA
jgi:peptidoglycan/xylan/chitin deacetylase (PgdA/CDA1 family)